MNKKEQMKIANEFNGEGRAYVCAEYSEKEQPMVLSGDMKVILFIITRMIDRVGMICNQSWEDTYRAVKVMHDLGEEEDKAMS